MGFNYAALSKPVKALIAGYGKPAVFYRNGSKVAAANVVETASTQADEPNSLLAQTAQTRKTLLVAPTQKPLQVGDTAVIEKNTYTVTNVSEFRPGPVTLYVTLEVV